MKTEETKTIESLLRSYYPTHIAGNKLNKHRGRSLAFECVVNCGSTLGGIVDCVRIDETLTNEQRLRFCSPALHKEKPYYQNFEPPCGVSLEMLPKYCDDTKCRCNSLMITYNNDILITCFEIKVTKSDFHSKNGHNFCGNANFYVMPSDLYEQVKNEIPKDIGVIVHRVTEKVSDLRKVKDCNYHQLSNEDSMWMILNVLKKNRIR